MDKKGVSPSRIRQAVQVLRASLKQAVQDGLIGRDPAEGVKTPREVEREMLYVTSRQVSALSRAAQEISPGTGVLVTFYGLYRFAVVRASCPPPETR